MSAAPSSRTNRVSPEGAQDLQERWFAGVHSDVGGGYPEGENALSRVPLRWMIEEPKAVGMRVNPAVEAQLKLHVQDPQEIQAAQHESLRGPWWLLEYIPQMHRRQVDGVWRTGLRIYRRLGWRSRQAKNELHDSVLRRDDPVKNPHW